VLYFKQSVFFFLGRRCSVVPGRPTSFVIFSPRARESGFPVYGDSWCVLLKFCKDESRSVQPLGLLHNRNLHALQVVLRSF